MANEKVDFIPYAKLTTAQKAMVDSPSEENRAMCAMVDLGLDKLIDDESSWVRREVARKGFRPQVMIGDKDWTVRLAVSDQDYGLDKLINDPSEDVRTNVIRNLEDKGLTIEEWIALYPDRCALPENQPVSKLEVHTNELLAEYQAVMVDICRSLGVEPRVDIADPTYYQEVIDNAVAGLREPSLKNAAVLKQSDDNALLFTGSNVEPFVIVSGYDPEKKDWSAGSYYSDLRDAVRNFDQQCGTLAYSYNLDHEDLYPLLEERGFEPTPENVRTLMLESDDFSGLSYYLNENLTSLLDGDIGSCEEVLEQSPAKTMPEKSFHARCVEQIKAQQQSKSCNINPKNDLAQAKSAIDQTSSQNRSRKQVR